MAVLVSVLTWHEEQGSPWEKGRALLLMVDDGARMGVEKSIGVGEMVGTSVDVAAGVVAEVVGVG